jgi:hypothetical protein
LTEASKEALEKFAAHPQVKAWFDGVGAQLKDSTRNQYVLFLMRYFAAEDPAPFLKRAQEHPREVAIEIKTKLGELHKHSMNAAHLTKYALRSFLEFHEVEVGIKSKVKVRRVREKHELRWEDADRIILEADEPYRGIFNFMRWSGLGEDEFMEIQTSPSLQRKIEAQRSNEKPYVKIQLSPRKSTLDDFFTVTPKQYVPGFPLNTKAYKDRGRKLIDPHDIQNVWRRAAKKAGLWQAGLGPHTLRSVFRSQCARAGVPKAVSEFCMGHGGGDQYGYSREVLDEQYVASELRKMWAGQTGTTDPQTSGLAKLTATGWNIDSLTDMEKESVYQFFMQKLKPQKPEAIRTMTVSLGDMKRLIESMNPARTRISEQPHKHRTKRTAHNGGTPLHAPYETRIVGERELVPLLNEGYDLVKELADGRVIVRKPLDDEE